MIKQCANMLAATLVACLSTPSGAQVTYPVRAITIVVPSAAGGSPDAMMRLLAAELQKHLHQHVEVVDVPGDGGQTGMVQGLHAAPDGYTLTYANVVTLAVNKSLYRQLKYDPDVDAMPVALVAFTQNALVVRDRSPFKSLADVLAYARAHPGKLTLASPGAGTTGHLAGVLLTMRAGVKLAQVPYPGSQRAIDDLLAGQVDLMFDNLASIGNYVQSGQVRALALSGEKRSRIAPGVPTVAEGGLLGYAAVSWGGLVAPRGTDPGIVDRLNQLVNQILAEPAIQDKFAAIGFETYIGPALALTGVARLEAPRWEAVIRQAALPPR